MVIALAGRRIDAADAKSIRFASNPESIDCVRRRLHRLFVSEGATGLVSSAACGADLLALEEAGRLGLRRKIVLPFDPGRFRESSVVDRGGDWGPLFDAAIKEVASRDDLIALQSESGSDPYLEVNHAIIEEALAMGHDLRCRVSAVRVWEGQSRGEGDVTEEFGVYAGKRDVPLLGDVLTV
jgi:hypothetical protein